MLSGLEDVAELEITNLFGLSEPCRIMLTNTEQRRTTHPH